MPVPVLLCHPRDAAEAPARAANPSEKLLLKQLSDPLRHVELEEVGDVFQRGTGVRGD